MHSFEHHPKQSLEKFLTKVRLFAPSGLQNAIRLLFILKGYSRLMHVGKRFRLGFWSALASLPFVVPATLMPLVHRNRTVVVLNQAGLGHNIYEFLSIYDDIDSEKITGDVTIIYLAGCKSEQHLPALFEGWEKLIGRLAGRVELVGLSCTTWMAVAAFVSVADMKRFSVLASSREFRRYTTLDKNVARSLFDFDTKPSEKYPLHHLMDHDSGFCILGIRDANFYLDGGNVRSSSVELYEPTVRYLLRLGIPVVRGGRVAQSRLDIDHPLFFDYASSEFQNDSLDLALLSRASFAVGDSYGLLDGVAAFGSDVLMATHPLWPHKFISHRSIYFATQRVLNSETGQEVPLTEIVNFLNAGGRFNGSDRNVPGRNWAVKGLEQSEVLEATKWFLKVRAGEGGPSWNHPKSESIWAVEVLNKLEQRSAYTSNPDDWESFQGNWWPRSIELLRD